MKAENSELDFRDLKRKIFSQALVIFAGAVLAVLLLRSLASGRAGNLIVELLATFFHYSFEESMILYQLYFRNNISLYMLGVVVLFLLLFFRFFLSWFMKYFGEVNEGINILISNEKKNIQMAPEMGFMEKKLSVLQSTLAEREKSMKEAEQRKNDLVVYLAHDIKTPLTSVIGYLSLLDESKNLPEKQREEHIQIALLKAKNLETLTQEFFEITQYNAHRISLNKEKFDLYYLNAQVIDELHPMLKQNNIQACLHIPEDSSVYGDSNKLARAFTNIMKNAVTYSKKNSKIDIFAEQNEKDTTISFQNTGSVIPVDQLSKIFDKFYRLDEARSTNTGGSGLGLAIVKDIIELHGGTIFAASENEVTVFKVTLPNYV